MEKAAPLGMAVTRKQSANIDLRLIEHMVQSWIRNKVAFGTHSKSLLQRLTNTRLKAGLITSSCIDKKLYSILRQLNLDGYSSGLRTRKLGLAGACRKIQHGESTTKMAILPTSIEPSESVAVLRELLEIDPVGTILPICKISLSTERLLGDEIVPVFPPRHCVAYRFLKFQILYYIVRNPT